MKNSIIFILAVVAAGLVALNLHQHFQGQDAGENIAALEEKVTAAEARSEKNLESQDKAVRRDYETRIAVLEEELRLVRSEAEAILLQERNAKKKDSPFKGLSKLMENPAMAEMIRGQQKVALETMFGSLFKEFDFNAEELELFKELLLDKQMGAVEASMAMMGGELSAEQREELSQNLKEFNREMDQDIKNFLNSEEDYKTYEHHQESQGERMQVDAFKKALTGAGQTLDPGVEESLVEAMYEERKNFSFSSNLDDQADFDLSDLTEDKLTRHMEEMKGLDENIHERARAILDADQLARFEESQQSMRDMRDMSTKMAAQMFGNPDGEADTTGAATEGGE